MFFVRWKVPPLADKSTKICIWIQYSLWVNVSFVLYVKAVSSVRKNQDDLLLKISVSTSERSLQIFFCQKLVMSSNRHQLSGTSLQWFDAIQNLVSRAVKNFCPRASTTLKAGTSTWFCEKHFLNCLIEFFADALLLAKQCWKTNTADFHLSV